MSAPSARRGFTLLELMVVVGFVSLFTLLLGGAVHTGVLVSRDATVDVELSDLASQIADEVQARAMTAATTPMPAAVPQGAGWGPRLDPPALAFQQRFAGPSGVVEGAWVNAGHHEEGWLTRVSFVPDATALGGVLDEASLGIDVPAGVDTNGDGVIDRPGVPDGDLTDAFALGRIVVELLDASLVPVPGMSRSFGGGRTYALWNRAAAPALPPLFSRVDAGGFESREPVREADAGLQLNLMVVHLPVPGADGRPELRCLHVTRAIAPR